MMSNARSFCGHFLCIWKGENQQDVDVVSCDDDDEHLTFFGQICLPYASHLVQQLRLFARHSCREYLSANRLKLDKQYVRLQVALLLVLDIYWRFWIELFHERRSSQYQHARRILEHAPKIVNVVPLFCLVS